jgi:parallel beta helix pectate lyase-like protein
MAVILKKQSRVNSAMGGNTTMIGTRSHFVYAALALLLCMTMVAGATTYYVRTDGNDTWWGTDNTNVGPAGAKATLYAMWASPSVQNGDTIQIAPGTYSASRTIPLFRSNLIIRGSDPVNRPVLEYTSFSVTATVSDVTLENLVINNRHTANDIIRILDGAQNVYIVNCEIKNSANIVPAVLEGHGCISVETCNGLYIDGCQLIEEPTSTPHAYLNLLNTYTIDSLGEQFPGSNNWAITNTEFRLDQFGASLTGHDIYCRTEIHTMLVQGCTFTNSGAEHILFDQVGILPRHYYSNIDFVDNGFHELQAGQASIKMEGPNTYDEVSFVGNLWSDCHISGIFFSGHDTVEGTEIDGLTIRDNVFLNIGGDGGNGTYGNSSIVIDDALFAASAGRGNNISNNKIIDNRTPKLSAHGIMIQSSGDGLLINNNEITNCINSCIHVGGSPRLPAPNQGIYSLLAPIIMGNSCTGADGGGITLTTGRSTTAANIGGNVITDCDSYGVGVLDATHTNTSISNNDITGCGAGVYVAGPNTSVYKNEIWNSVNTSRAGIYLAIWGTLNSDDVSDCVVSFNMTSGCAGYGINLSEGLYGVSGNVNVINNTIVGNAPNGVNIGLDGVNFYNNIIAMHSGVGVTFSATTEGSIGYNLYWNLLGTDTSGLSAFPYTGDMVGVNPAFESLVPPLDYHLQGTSQALGAGADLSGTTFTPNVGIDLGAYQTNEVNTNVSKSQWEIYR